MAQIDDRTGAATWVSLVRNLAWSNTESTRTVTIIAAAALGQIQQLAGQPPVLFSIILTPVFLAFAVEGNLALFETAETRGQGDWDTATRPSGTKIYVAKAPALVIAADGIEAAEVSQMPVYADYRDGIDHELRKRFGMGREPSAPPIGYYYEISFTLGDRAAKQFISFAGQNDRWHFEARLGGRHLGYGFLLGPFSGNVLTLPVDHDESALRRLLSPLGSRVIWKDGER